MWRQWSTSATCLFFILHLQSFSASPSQSQARLRCSTLIKIRKLTLRQIVFYHAVSYSIISAWNELSFDLWYCYSRILAGELEKDEKLEKKNQVERVDYYTDKKEAWLSMTETQLPKQEMVVIKITALKGYKLAFSGYWFLTDYNIRIFSRPYNKENKPIKS